MDFSQLKQRKCCSLSLWRKGALFIATLSLLLTIIVQFGGLNDNAVTSAAPIEVRGESVLRVGFVPTKGLSEFDENGNRKGVVIDYLNEISKYTNWKYEYVDLDIADALDKIENGEIDVMGGMFRSALLETLYAYPDYNIGRTKAVLFAKWGDARFSGYNVEDFEGMKIGAFTKATENIDRLKAYLKMNNVNCEIVTYDSDVYSHLDAGDVDLVLSNISDDNGDYRAVDDFDSRPFYLVTTLGNSGVLDGLNTALKCIYDSNPSYAEQCYVKHFSELNTYNIVLNDEEKAYVAANPVIKVAVPESFHPLFCLNSTDTHNGIVYDMLARVTEFSGLKFEYVLTDTYEQAVDAVQLGKADILGFYMGDEAYSFDDGLARTRSYNTLHCLIVRNKAVTYPSEHLTAAIVSGSKLFAKIEAENIKYYSTIKAALNAVNSGDADFVFGISALIEHELQSNYYANLTPVSIYDGNADVSFAVRRPADANLFGILNKSISILTTAEKQAIGSANMISLGEGSRPFSYFIHANPVLFGCILAAVVLLVATVIILIMYQRMKIVKIESDLEKKDAASAAKSQFFSQLSHEIRTPMNGIVGMTELCKRSVDDPAQVKMYLDKISLSSGHMLAVINDVLDMSKIEMGKMELNIDRFDFGDLLRSQALGFYDQTKEKNIQFETILYGLLEEELSGDALKLSQIISNLLSNAVKFTPEGGKIFMRIFEMLREKDKIWIRIVVEDSGCGIARENLDRIFFPFEQESAGTTRKYGGTGLGLSIIKKYVEFMGGRISVESELGAGSRFTVELPFEYFPVAEEEKCGDGSRVLLVGDGADKTRHIMQLIEWEGYSVDVANTSECLPDIITRAYEEGKPYKLCLIKWDGSIQRKGDAKEISRAAANAGTQISVVGFDVGEIGKRARELNADSFILIPVFHKNLSKLMRQCGISKLLGDSDNGQPNGVDSGEFLKGKNVLIVEDTAINREVAMGMIKLAGAEAETACNGKEAVEKFQKSQINTFDLILMDMQMPVMDGLEATRQIRALPREDAGKVMIFAMTANALGEDVKRCIESGMDAHIGKPFNLQDIQNTYEAQVLKRKNN